MEPLIPRSASSARVSIEPLSGYDAIMNFKRKKSKRSVRCTLCTQHRWRGNGNGRFAHSNERHKPAPDKAMRGRTFIETLQFWP